MKTTILKSVLFVTLAAGFNSCVNDDDYAIPTMECTETNLVKTIEVSAVPFGTLAQYTADDVIEAYVTSSDEGGNFFKSISMQTLDGSKAFSVPVDASSTFVNLEPGRKVFIKLKNLYTDSPQTSGPIGPRIGGIYVTSSGAASVGRLPESQFKEAVVRSCTVIDEETLVKPVTIPQLLANNDYLNKLVELDNVQFSDAAVGKTYYVEGASNTIGGATNHSLTDFSGNSIDFRTSSFANFAGKIVPSASGKVRGVLTKYGSGYQFMARTERDIKLTGQRVVAFYYEDFQESVDNTNFNYEGWTNVATSGTKLWREEAFSGNGYAEFSSFGSGNALNVAWLVTPGIDMDAHTGETMLFRTAQHHLDVNSDANSLKVYVSSDFTGNPATATWIEVPVTLPTMDTAWYAFVGSGGVDLSGYTGTIHIGFKFTGSGTDTTLDGAFQIDDLKILGN
ncbi:DUF5689 domain-containing protein [Flavobacterium pallidum]|uniref:DUF5017 domain-containing protein n=1 Tax=Flavobacterium pallidum TaxID=2172098 RepID=A0A2S1SER3_9FLAO|nr:DUF5689 domain-containing protein [Flavobacterium pallidum]AWI24906.1 DUF5017 domain-containing protein [Flavobacterium pallidum]